MTPHHTAGNHMTSPHGPPSFPSPRSRMHTALTTPPQPQLRTTTHQRLRSMTPTETRSPRRTAPARNQAIPPAATSTWTDTYRAETTRQFADTGWGWFTHRSDYPAWQATCEQARASARACGDARAEVLKRHQARLLPYRPRRPPDRRRNHRRRDQDRLGQRRPRWGSQRPRARRDLRHGSRELHRCHRTLQPRPGLLAPHHPHQRGAAILERNLGRAYAALGDTRQADQHLQTALGIFTSLDEAYHQARTLYVIAEIRLQAGQPAEAAALLQQARPLMERVDHPLSLSELLTQLADAHARVGDTHPARHCLDEAIALQKTLHLPDSHPARVRVRTIAAQLAQAPGEQELS
jgi:tetratricopeptide (TPR) repeat protein